VSFRTSRTRRLDSRPSSRALRCPWRRSTRQSTTTSAHGRGTFSTR
jgi:hypothetical protein